MPTSRRSRSRSPHRFCPAPSGIVNGEAGEGGTAGVVDEGVAGEDDPEPRGPRPPAVIDVLEGAQPEPLVERADPVQNFAADQQAEARQSLDVFNTARVR